MITASKKDVEEMAERLTEAVIEDKRKNFTIRVQKVMNEKSKKLSGDYYVYVRHKDSSEDDFFEFDMFFSPVRERWTVTITSHLSILSEPHEEERQMVLDKVRYEFSKLFDCLDPYFAWNYQSYGLMHERDKRCSL